MSTATEHTETPARPDYAQYVVCVVLVLVGGFLIYDALSLPGWYAKVDPVGPRLFPIVIGVGLVLMTVVLAIAIARGSRGEPDGGEDIDLRGQTLADAPADRFDIFPGGHAHEAEVHILLTLAREAEEVGRVHEDMPLVGEIRPQGEEAGDANRMAGEP